MKISKKHESELLASDYLYSLLCGMQAYSFDSISRWGVRTSLIIKNLLVG
jgi:hypothetical protein